jgi:hypothetical protein
MELICLENRFHIQIYGFEPIKPAYL